MLQLKLFKLHIQMCVRRKRMILKGMKLNTKYSIKLIPLVCVYYLRYFSSSVQYLLVIAIENYIQDKSVGVKFVIMSSLFLCSNFFLIVFQEIVNFTSHDFHQCTNMNLKKLQLQKTIKSSQEQKKPCNETLLSHRGFCLGQRIKNPSEKNK